MLAFTSTPGVDRIARRLDDADALHRRLERVRRLGYSLSHDEPPHGVGALAVAVLDDTGRAVASLAILAPVNRADRLPRHIDALRGAAGRLSQALYRAA